MILPFDQPALLWLLLLLIPVVWLGLISLATLSPVRRWLAILLRAAALIILVFMLAGMHWARWHNELAVVAVIDESESVRRFAKPPSVVDESSNAPSAGEEVTVDQWARKWVKASSKSQKPDDYSGLVTFSGSPSVQSLPEHGLNFDSSSVARNNDGSDYGAAVRQGIALFPQDVSKRILLFGDGNENAKSARQGGANNFATGGSDLLDAAYEAKQAGIPIDVVPIEYKVEHEVMVQGVYAPSEARDGQTVALRVVLRGTEPSAGTLFLKHDGLPVDLNGDAAGTGVPIGEKQWSADAEADTATGKFICVKMIEVPLLFAGANKFQAVFEPLSKAADTMASNNQAETFTLVHGKGRILFLDNVGGDPGKVLSDSLASHGILLDVGTGRDLPPTLAELQRYDGVILQNVPAEMVMPAQQKMLSRYVNDMGGGLIMVGGPDSFGAGGWTNTPVDQLLPVNCQVPNQTVLPTGALVLVIDRSGSMAYGMKNSSASKMVLANEAGALAVATLYPQDMVGVVAFDDGGDWIVNLQPNTNSAATIKKIRSIQIQGGTNIYPALVMAYDALAPVKADQAALKHIILLTDGQSQQGKYFEIVGKMREAGITLSTVGVGDDVDGVLLNQLAQMGGGTYHPISDPNRLPQVFIKEARSIRKNLIKEQIFKPRLTSTGSPIMSGIKAVPELKGFVLTGPKTDPRIYTPMQGPEGEPLFAHWQVGLGRVAAFTSDATNRWATPWLAWGGYGDFWSRTVRAIARPSASRDYDLLTTVRNDTLHVRLDASTGAAKGGATFMNFLTVQGSVLKPDGNVANIELKQTGPGVYEADMAATDQGNYIVSLMVQGQNSEPSMVFGGASHAAGAELRQFSSNRALLERVAEITGGRVLDPKEVDPEAVYNRAGVVPSRSVRPLWRPLLAALLAIFLIDVAVRRIAWDFVAMWQEMKRWLGSAMGTLSPRREEAPATLAALKTRAAEVGEKLAKPGEPARGTAPQPVVATNRKFEAAGDAVADDDFTSAVGGANADGSSSDLAAAARAKTGNEGPTTSRLLDVKRRAQKNMNDPNA